MYIKFTSSVASLLFFALPTLASAQSQVDSAAYYHEAAVKNANVGNLELATSQLRRAISHAPHDPQLRFNLGLALLNSGEKTEAEAQFEIAALATPPHAGAVYSLGTIARIEGNKESAKEHYLRAVQLDSGYVDALLQLGSLLAIEDRYDAAIGWFQKAGRLYPGSALPKELIYLALQRKAVYQRGMESGYVRVRHIMVKTRQQADMVLQALDHGADFALLALNLSGDPSAEVGGDMGFFAPGDMLPAFEEAIYAIEANQITPIIQTPAGFHVLMRSN